MLAEKLQEAAGNSADATLYVDDVFSTYLYTGNGSTKTITNGIDLAGQGGMVWIKSRSAATDHKLTDTARGATKALISDTTGAQTTDANGLTAFSSTGFSIGTDSIYNTNAATYASWTFRKAAKFFDVVTWTGNDVAGRQIAHSLGIAPGMMIVKRTNTTGNWQVYSNGLTSAAYSIQLNLTNGQASAPTVWNSTAPTSSVFSVGTDDTVNVSGNTYVAYLFAHDTSSTGIIQCGSFMSTGNVQDISLGWEPQYLMVKRTDSADDWYVDDVMRGMTTNRDYALLYPNLNSPELVGAGSPSTPSSGYAAPTATGFQFPARTAGRNYIYMAIRRPNKPPTSGTQVFLPTVKLDSTNPQTVTTGFTVDWAWAKGNINVSPASPTIIDRLRGTTLGFIFNPGAESTNANIVDLIYSNQYVNKTFTASGVRGIGYAFSRAPGFFDVVCYTGNYNNPPTEQVLAHNLTVTPELIIGHNRTDGSSYSYSTTTGIDYYLNVNTANASSGPRTDMWGTPTSTSFTVKQYTNILNNTFVTYLFATLAGISKVGSYTGNGTGQAIACGFSAGARFVLIKRTDATGNWYAFDSARGLTSGSSPYLIVNNAPASAEVTGNNGVYASTGGFTLGATAITTTNIAAATYIFLAVA